MTEIVYRAIDCSLRVMNLVGSMSPDELPETMPDEFQVRLQKVVNMLQGFEKTALLKTRKGMEAAQEIERAAMNLEKALSSLRSGDLSSIMESLSTLEQRVEDLQKTIEKLKRVVT